MNDEINLVAVSKIAEAFGTAVAGLWDGIDGNDVQAGFDLVKAFFGVKEANAELSDLNLAERELLVDLVGVQVKKSLRIKAALGAS